MALAVALNDKDRDRWVDLDEELRDLVSTLFPRHIALELSSQVYPQDFLPIRYCLKIPCVPYSSIDDQSTIPPAEGLLLKVYGRRYVPYELSTRHF